MKQAWVLVAVCLATLFGLVVNEAQAKKPIVNEPILYGSIAEEEWVTPFPPQGEVNGVTVILVHGGGWHAQPHRTEMVSRAQTLAQNGFIVFTIDYPQVRNVGEQAFPRVESAIKRAVHWVQEHTGEYGGDPARIVIEGESAGGHLAGLTALKMNQVVPGTIKAAEILSGTENIYALAQSVLKGEDHLDLGKHTKHMERLFDCAPLAQSCVSESFGLEWSPVGNVRSGSCMPWLIASREIDPVPLSQQEEMKATLEAAGCPVKLVIFPGKGHEPKLGSEGIDFLKKEGK